MAVSAYLAIIGPSPTCGPADHATALAYLTKIQHCLTPALKSQWTNSERIRLWRLEQKWRDRAYGHDLRFELVGTQDGRLDQETEWRIYQAKRKRYGFAVLPMPEPEPTPALTPRQRRYISSLGGQARAAQLSRDELRRNGRAGGLATQAKRRAELAAQRQEHQRA